PRDTTDLPMAQFKLLRFNPNDICGPDGEAAADLQARFCAMAVVRVRQLLDVILRGIFWLRAIRPVQREGYVDSAILTDEHIIGSRSVGQGGEYTHALARRFAYNVMEPVAWSGDGQINYRYLYVDPQILDLLRDPDWPVYGQFSRRVWKGMGEEEKK